VTRLGVVVAFVFSAASGVLAEPDFGLTTGTPPFSSATARKWLESWERRPKLLLDTRVRIRVLFCLVLENSLFAT
jgi:hypothetical protein